jgi:hypothetical protein
MERRRGEKNSNLMRKAGSAAVRRQRQFSTFGVGPHSAFVQQHTRLRETAPVTHAGLAQLALVGFLHLQPETAIILLPNARSPMN